MPIQLDTLDYANDLEKAGFPRQQAEALAKLQARTVNDLVEHELVTKDVLKAELSQLEHAMRDEVRGQLSGLREETREQLSGLREETRDQVAGLRGEMLVQLSSLRGEMLGQGVALREEVRSNVTGLRDALTGETSDRRHQIDGVQVQIRALQFGGAIAAFALGAIVLLTRLIG